MKKEFLETDSMQIRDILSKSLDMQVLNMTEVTSLLEINDDSLWNEVFEVAGKVKDKVYGKRIVLFAPLYLSNECMNDCLYCGFRSGNKEASRKTLTIDEAVGEAGMLSDRGFRRLLLVTSEHNKRAGIEYIEQVVNAIYKKTDIRILHANTAPMDVEDFRRLKSCEIGVYQCFQETYHIPSYRYLHPSGTKADD